jgi:hypothetical protein
LTLKHQIYSYIATATIIIIIITTTNNNNNNNNNNMKYLLTAIGLTPGGSSTVHIYTQTIHRTTQKKQHLKQHKNNLKQCWPCPVLVSFTLAFALQLRKSTEKPQSG